MPRRYSAFHDFDCNMNALTSTGFLVSTSAVLLAIVAA